ncbi:hypothetical protein GCM10027598_44980 [Amycolatopsis oliviviridis]|uniref:Uncharacterized protein n=1 Tax=Amycolatopsis oliviviridis TaxID=1471590 RepID=A0ABQ3L924_9PSEU|nr:hypothetical protein [Amycolatopsis oliviviridis]GHH09185.1 hypothetical protein GCM10017790_16850 [Amycolatopsis oliviviridis]
MPAEPDPVRAEGPPVVNDGEDMEAKLLVLDPAGEGKNGELPATWRPLATRRRIIWCRLPVDGALGQADDLLGDTETGDPQIDVVAAGEAAEAALRLAERHPGAASHVLLIDPVPDESSELADRVRATGTAVKVLPHSTGEPYNRVPPPLPLGHPDVVAGIAKILEDV